jgi:excisionase family DNA binding protein
VTLNEAAAELGIQQATLRQQIANGKLKARKVGRDWLITPGEVARYRREQLGRRGRPPRAERAQVPARQQTETLVIGTPSALEVEQFHARVDRSGGPDACWPWMGTRGYSGYGVVGRFAGHRNRRAHRVAWFLEHGDLGSLHVLHQCDNPPCCNPTHMRIGTHQDNIADAKAKGRTGAGTRASRR